MPLIFPNNPTVNQTYQSGSTATYQWDGTKWTVVQPPSTTVVSARSATTAQTASYLDGSIPTYIQANKSGDQTLANSVVTTVTGFATPSVNLNAGEWNGTTGVFTATKAGVYDVSFTVQLATGTYPGGTQIAPVILKNGAQIAGVSWFTTGSYIGFPAGVSVSSMLSLEVSNTLSVGVFQTSAASRTLLASATTLTIQELPTRIQR